MFSQVNIVHFKADDGMDIRTDIVKFLNAQDFNEKECLLG